jgi:glycosyltransferase involved in cell wall biosynthesis
VVDKGKRMRVLFIHQNFPGQFRHLAPALAAQGHEVRALVLSPRQISLAGVNVHQYAVQRTNGRAVHPWAVDFESKTIRAEACARRMAELSTAGFTPDLVIGHPFWGETWMVKDVWPRAKMLAYQEFYYGADTNFDPEFLENDLDHRFRIRAKNASLLMGLETMDWGLSPTEWQRAQFPAHFRQRISVVFDGIDADRACPGRVESLTIGTPEVTLREGQEIVTFVSRNLEPYRGYHIFMRALPRLLELRPQARVVIVGGGGASYGPDPDTGSWRERFLDEVRGRIDLTRVHFVGTLRYSALVDLFRLTRCHVYLTYPFVLSWSMIDAMSAGALVLGSLTPPVEEVIRDGENGLLVDFFDAEGIAALAAKALAEPDHFTPLRERARQTVLERYALQDCLPRQLALVQALSRGEPPTL